MNAGVSQSVGIAVRAGEAFEFVAHKAIVIASGARRITLGAVQISIAVRGEAFVARLSTRRIGLRGDEEALRLFVPALVAIVFV